LVKIKDSPVSATSSNSNKFSPFTLFFYSSLYSYILHDRTHDIKDKLLDFYGNKPFLALGSLVENVKIREKDPSVHVYSINMFQFDVNDFSKIINDNMVESQRNIDD